MAKITKPFSITAHEAGFTAGVYTWNIFGDPCEHAETIEEAKTIAKTMFETKGERIVAVRIGFKPFKTKPGTEHYVKREDMHMLEPGLKIPALAA